MGEERDLCELRVRADVQPARVERDLKRLEEESPAKPGQHGTAGSDPSVTCEQEGVGHSEGRAVDDVKRPAGGEDEAGFGAGANQQGAEDLDRVKRIEP